MRNMKSLQIFQNYVIKEKRNSKGYFGECERPKANVTQRSPWNSIYVTFLFEIRVETFLLMLLVDWLMRAYYCPHSLYSFELWVVEVFCWFDFMLFIAICGLFSYAMSNMDHFECKHVLWIVSFCMPNLIWLSNWL